MFHKTMIKTTAKGDQVPAFHMKIWTQLVCSAVVCMVLTSFVTKEEEANKMEKLCQFQMVQSFKILTLN